MGENEEARASSVQQAKRIEDECTQLNNFYTITSLRWAKGVFWQKSAITLLKSLPVITTGSVFSQIFSHNIFAVYFATVVSLAVTLLIPLLNLHKPEERAALHETARRKLLHFKHKLFYFTPFMLSTRIYQVMI